MVDAGAYPSPTGAQMSDGVGPFYSTANLSSRNGTNEHFNNDEMNRINPELQNNVHPSHIDSYAVNQAHDHALAQSVLSLQGHHIQSSYQQLPVTMPDQNTMMDAGELSAAAAARQRLKVSRACDECRRKKVISDQQKPHLAIAKMSRFDATRLQKTKYHHARLAESQI